MADDLHTKVAVMAQDINYIKGELAEIKLLIKEHISEEEERYERIITMKADKWTEKAIYWTAAGIIAAAMGLVWAVVTKTII